MPRNSGPPLINSGDSSDSSDSSDSGDSSRDSNFVVPGKKKAQVTQESTMSLEAGDYTVTENRSEKVPMSK